MWIWSFGIVRQNLGVSKNFNNVVITGLLTFLSSLIEAKHKMPCHPFIIDNSLWIPKVKNWAALFLMAEDVVR